MAQPEGGEVRRSVDAARLVKLEIGSVVSGQGSGPGPWSGPGPGSGLDVQQSPCRAAAERSDGETSAQLRRKPLRITFSLSSSRSLACAPSRCLLLPASLGCVADFRPWPDRCTRRRGRLERDRRRHVRPRERLTRAVESPQHHTIFLLPCRRRWLLSPCWWLLSPSAALLSASSSAEQLPT